FFNRFDTSRWTTPGGDFAAFASTSTMVSTSGLYTWTSTPALVADVQRWLDDPSSNFGWLLLGQENRPGNVHGFATRETGPAFAPPRLTVEFEPAVPEPGSLVLLAVGVLCMAGYLRRRRNGGRREELWGKFPTCPRAGQVGNLPHSLVRQL